MYNNTKEERDTRASSTNDEIDLLFIFRKIGDGFQALGNSISYALSVIKKYFIMMLIVSLVGAAFGYLLYYVTKPYYTSSMTLMLSDIRNEFMTDQLNKLSIMINEDNFEAIADNLDISVESASQIKGMTFFNLDEDRIAEDSVLTGSPFRIEIMLYNNQLFDTMEPALANYLENNRYFSKQKRIRQQQMQSMISKYKNDIESLDSVKTTVTSPKGPVNGFVYGQPIDPSNLYRESINMYEEQIELEAKLEKLDNVEVVTGFVARLRPTGPKLLKYLLGGALIAFILGLIVALRIDSRNRRLAS